MSWRKTFSRRCRVALMALALDCLLGDPPNRWHPVGLMGRWLRYGEQRAPAPAQLRLGWGALWLAGGWLVFGGAAALAPRHPLIQAGIASLLLAYRGLDRAVASVEEALAADDLDEARRLLGWHLVSRPTGDLSAAEVAGAAIESLAENLSDSVIAPLLALLAGGLPAMVIYRFTNTADAMWGYRNERFEYLGKVAARCDDALNLIPARLTALLIALAAQFNNRRGRVALSVAWRDARRTASPNAGWPMAAMAGALDTVLTKRAHYALGDGACISDHALIARARRLARLVMIGIGVGLAGGMLVGAAKKERS